MMRNTAGLGPLFVSRQMTGPQAWALIEPVRCALQRLLDGVGIREDLAGVGMALNLAWLRCQKIGDSKDAMGVIEAGLVALQRAERRQEEHGQPGFDGPGRTAVLEAINLYDVILRASSLQQWANAETALLKSFQSLESA